MWPLGNVATDHKALMVYNYVYSDGSAVSSAGLTMRSHQSVLCAQSLALSILTGSAFSVFQEMSFIGIAYACQPSRRSISISMAWAFHWPTLWNWSGGGAPVLTLALTSDNMHRMMRDLMR